MRWGKMIGGIGKPESVKKIAIPSIQIVPDVEIRRRKRTSLNRIVDISDWRPGGELCRYMQSMNEGPYIHRKAWEYGLCVQGLFELGAITPTARGLGVAAGYERPLFYLTNFVEKIVATDLYDNPDHEGKPEMLTNPEKFAWCPWNKDRLEVISMDACNLQFTEESFDFCFSLSSIEHFGPRENTKKAMSEMTRVLKPGGICCIITELILNGTTHPEYFSPSEFREVVLETPGLEIVGGELDWTISRSLVDSPINLDVDDHMVSPHIVLKRDDNIWTSASVFFRKTP